jgi:hypothetical protein
MPVWLTAMLNPPTRPAPAFMADVCGGGIEPLARFVAISSKGERNNRLYWATRRARELVERRVIPGELAVRRLTQAAAAAGLFGPEVTATIRSGLTGQATGGKRHV